MARHRHRSGLSARRFLPGSPNGLPSPSVPHSITISPSSPDVEVDTSQQLTVIVYDQFGLVLPNVPLRFASSNPAIATVSALGLVAGVEAGSAVITVYAQSASASVTVAVTGEVVLQPTTLTLLPATLTIAVGDTAQLTSEIEDQHHDPIDGTVNFASSDESVATVSETGLVTAISAGSALITGEVDGYPDATDTVPVTVPAVRFVESVHVSPSSFALGVGETRQLSAESRDQFGDVYADTHTWSSSDDAVATVSGSGLVTAVAEGTVTITATSIADDEVTDTSEGTVTEVPAWAVPGIHADAVLFDHGGLYAGANDTERTAALQAAFAAHSKYGEVTNAANISITSAIMIDGFPVMDYHQPGGTAATPQPTAPLPSAQESWWTRFKCRLPVDWTRNGTGPGASGAAGYKWCGWGWQGVERRSSIEFDGPQVYMVQNILGADDPTTAATTRGQTADMNFASIPDPVVTAQTYDVIVLHKQVSPRMRRCLVFFAIDGSEPVWVGDHYIMTAAGSIPKCDRFQAGLNLNRILAAGQDQHLYWGPWQIIPYAANPDPWGRIAAYGGNLDAMRMPDAMTITGISGTVISGVSDNTLIITGSGFQGAPNGYRGLQLCDADSLTPLVLTAYTVNSDTQITAHLNATGTPPGTYHLSVVPTPGYAGLTQAQSVPFAFTVAEANEAPNAPTAGNAIAATTSSLTFPLQFAASGGVATALAVRYSTDGGSNWTAHDDLETPGATLDEERNVEVGGLPDDATLTLQFAAKNASGTSAWSASVTGTTNPAEGGVTVGVTSVENGFVAGTDFSTATNDTQVRSAMTAIVPGGLANPTRWARGTDGDLGAIAVVTKDDLVSGYINGGVGMQNVRIRIVARYVNYTPTDVHNQLRWQLRDDTTGARANVTIYNTGALQLYLSGGGLDDVDYTSTDAGAAIVGGDMIDMVIEWLRLVDGKIKVTIALRDAGSSTYTPVVTKTSAAAPATPPGINFIDAGNQSSDPTDGRVEIKVFEVCDPLDGEGALISMDALGS